MPYLRKNSVCPLASTRWWRGFQYSSTFIILHKLHTVKTISRTLVLKSSKPTLLENSLEQLNIRYKLIKALHTKAQDFNGLNISFQYIRCRNSRNLIYAFLQMLTQKHIICRFISNTP